MSSSPRQLPHPLMLLLPQPPGYYSILAKLCVCLYLYIQIYSISVLFTKQRLLAGVADSVEIHLHVVHAAVDVHHHVCGIPRVPLPLPEVHLYLVHSDLSVVRHSELSQKNLFSRSDYTTLLSALCWFHNFRLKEIIKYYLISLFIDSQWEYKWNTYQLFYSISIVAFHNSTSKWIQLFILLKTAKSMKRRACLLLNVPPRMMPRHYVYVQTPDYYF